MGALRKMEADDRCSEDHVLWGFRFSLLMLWFCGFGGRGHCAVHASTPRGYRGSVLQRWGGGRLEAVRRVSDVPLSSSHACDLGCCEWKRRWLLAVALVFEVLLGLVKKVNCTNL